MSDEPLLERAVVPDSDVDTTDDTQTSIVIAARQSFSGPLPPPSAFREYEDVLPGAADRILTLAERNAQARRDQSSGQLMLAATALEADDAQSKRGMLLGFILSVGLLVVTLVLALEGATWPAVAAAVSQLAPILAVLVRRHRGRRD